MQYPYKEELAELAREEVKATAQALADYASASTEGFKQVQEAMKVQHELFMQHLKIFHGVEGLPE